MREFQIRCQHIWNNHFQTNSFSTQVMDKILVFLSIWNIKIFI